jgi:hypothetical protein
MPQTSTTAPAFTGQDETLTCRDCKQPFVFTAGEQDFYTKKGFNNRPTRCQPCREEHKANKNSKAPRR